MLSGATDGQGGQSRHFVARRALSGGLNDLPVPLNRAFCADMPRLFHPLARVARSLLQPPRRAQAIAVGIVAAAALLVGWRATSPSWSMGINWDTAGYATDIGNAAPWAKLPWNSHFGVGQVYWLAMHLAPHLGLTALDGLRFLNALALACSTGVLTICALHLRLRPVLAALTGGLYLASWGTLILVFTWEDNVLVHPAGLAALAICLFHLGAWRWRHSLYAGLAVGLSSLMSWQGAAYALPVMYVALVLAGRDRRWWQRARDVALVPLGLVLARWLWLSLYWLTAHSLSYASLVRTAFESPSPNFLPQGLSQWLALLGNPRAILTHMGIGVCHELGPSVRDSSAIGPYLPYLGAGLLCLALVPWMVAVARSRKGNGGPVHFIAAAFLFMTLMAAIYLDLPVDKYKRYDYIPAFISLAFAVVARHATSSRLRKNTRIFICVAASILVGQGVAAFRWNRQWYAKLPSTTPKDYAGHGNQTWFAYMRETGRQAPNACSFVFSFDEVLHARYQLEITAALLSELRQPKIIGAPPSAREWPRRLPLADSKTVAAGLRGCEWLSPGARRLVPGK